MKSGKFKNYVNLLMRGERGMKRESVWEREREEEGKRREGEKQLKFDWIYKWTESKCR